MPPRRAQTLDTLLPPILALLPNTYSAHQKALTTTARLLHTNPPQYSLAIEILFAVSKELLKGGEGGSGTELGVKMVDAMREGKVEIDEKSRANVTQLLALASPNGPWRKKLAESAVKWTQTVGKCPTGDANLLQYIGELYYKDHHFVEAEKYLLGSGKRDAAITLADMMYEWCDKGALDPGPYALRGVLPSLLHSPPSILPAITFLTAFLAHLTSSSSSFAASIVSTVPSQTLFSLPEIVLSTSPSLNFAQLALVAVQHAPAVGTNAVQAQGMDEGVAREWKALCTRYSKLSTVVAQKEVQEALSQIATEIFHVSPPRGAGNSDLLQNLMGSLFGGR
ncbi:uncharacterized protein L203_104988 [Cryptococcus depauperatus CBS 7841]|uniref:Uncharacterized protein n=1 Tax=Cryptococcus depauperatus CBS 7841 TaxID=1295531 RepID=A0A1E3I1C7_9TREE|nr:cytoplasmic protein [Cryptococcus depauperatus CBS 7841]